MHRFEVAVTSALLTACAPVLWAGSALGAPLSVFAELRAPADSGVAPPESGQAAPQGSSPLDPADATTPAAKRAAELLGLIARGDRRAMRAYMESAFAGDRPKQDVDQDLYQFGRLFLSSGGNFRVLRVRNLSRTEAVIVYRNGRLESDGALLVTVEEVRPHRIVAWEKGSPKSPSGASQPDLRSNRRRAGAIDAYAQRLSRYDYFSGTILVSSGDKLALHKSYGLADRSHRVPNTARTRFNLASLVKMFTAVAVAQLAEQGKLSLDDPVDKFMPGYFERRYATPVLVKHLLSHTSGTDARVLMPLVAGEASLRLNSHQDYLEALRKDDKKYRYEPGTRHEYSNHGFVLLGRIVEIASGQSYYDYVRTHIFEPSGMVDTGFPSLEDVIRGQAVGYETFWRDSGPWTENNWLRIPARGLASGGAYSTARDMLRFANALRSGRLLKPATLAELTSPKPQSPEYGYGFALGSTESGERIAGHTGDMAGVCASFDMVARPDNPITIVVLSNSSMGSCRPITQKIMEVFGLTTM